ncbi:hypothetical protein BDK92_7343 [Micromonospora pisi]|uniref:Uncharacterized protein n=1 Tax=Micromonospora pisi TaxID=589240 RepID=A0A495JVI6_9ACTN|nr:hypothetical protein BDK92_7343 [Micromonospora pisi]
MMRPETPSEKSRGAGCVQPIVMLVAALVALLWAVLG